MRWDGRYNYTMIKYSVSSSLNGSSVSGVLICKGAVHENIMARFSQRHKGLATKVTNFLPFENIVVHVECILYAEMPFALNHGRRIIQMRQRWKCAIRQ
ncbi:hypothetical protein ACFX1Z_030098 [Malus domestica]